MFLSHPLIMPVKNILSSDAATKTEETLPPEIHKIQISETGVTYSYKDSLNSFTLHHISLPSGLDTVSSEAKVREILDYLNRNVRFTRDTQVLLFADKFLFLPKIPAEVNRLHEEFSLSNNWDSRNELLLTHEIKDQDILLLYTRPRSAIYLLNEFFTEAQFRPVPGCLLEFFYSLHRGKMPEIFLHIQPERYELFAFSNTGFRFYNQFRYQSKEDFIYFILFTCEQLGMDPDRAPFRICGQIETRSAVYETLYKFVRNIDFLSPSSFLSHNNIAFPVHYFPLLLM